MNKLSKFVLKVLRKLYATAFSVKPESRPECIWDADITAKLIYDRLISEEPCMIARFGANELATVINYLGVHNAEKKSIIRYITGKEIEWWWNKNKIEQMLNCAGFFPPSEEKIEQFCELIISEIPCVDVLGSWLSDEKYFEKEMKNCQKIDLELLNPYFSKVPWTKALENKKILVIHLFAQSIEKQYKKRELLFENKDILPSFELKTIQAIQTLGGGDETPYADWFAALDEMKIQMDKVDYDICLIGCGAYGFPLATHAKRSGKKAVHMGGSLQLLFGIKGKRWENPNYNEQYNYAKLMNEHWIRPSKTEKPKNAEKVEGGCYW